MTLYIITSGEYSDYRINCVFLDHELAKEAVKIMGSGCRIEEYEASTELPESLNPGLYHMQVNMNVYGDTSYVGHCDSTSEIHNPYLPYISWGVGMVKFEMWALDDEHALKIANERRLKLIALNAWPENLQQFYDTKIEF